MKKKIQLHVAQPQVNTGDGEPDLDLAESDDDCGRNPFIVVEDVSKNDVKTEAELWVENGGRARENLQIVPAEECKDEDGNWTKWFRERLTETQMRAFEEYMSYVRTEPLLKNLSENYLIRFFAGYKFIAKTAFEKIVQSE